MCNNFRVLNVSNGHTMKKKQALKGVANFALAWVESGVSVRALTISEAIQARNQRAKIVEALPFAENPGLVYRATEANQAGARKERVLALSANEFYRLAGAANDLPVQMATMPRLHGGAVLRAGLDEGDL
jgi:hypothetical protein